MRKWPIGIWEVFCPSNNQGDAVLTNKNQKKQWDMSSHPLNWQKFKSLTTPIGKNMEKYKPHALLAYIDAITLKSK